MAKLYVTYRLNGQLETSEFQSRQPLGDTNHGPTAEIARQGLILDTPLGQLWIAPAAIQSVSTYPPEVTAEPEAPAEG